MSFSFIATEDSENYFVYVSGLLARQIVSFDSNFGMKDDKATNMRIDYYHFLFNS